MAHDPASALDAPVLDIQNLTKTYRLGIFRKKVEAVRGVSFAVQRGETFGLLGPNGAGKTTTIKMLLGLVFPTSGGIQRFGQRDRHAKHFARIGYMPENPYIYQYLRPMEFLDFCGRLTGMDARTRRARGEELLDKVGLRHAVSRPIGRFSKGMMQRIGLAQALLHDPEVLILDEPMSGLDPIGRREIRALLLDWRKRGKTLIFTSHILSDVETICDRVVIMNHGKVIEEGRLDALLRPEVRRFELALRCPALTVPPEVHAHPYLATLERHAVSLSMHGDQCQMQVEGDANLKALLAFIHDTEMELLTLVPQRETLEDLFVRLS